MATASDHVLHLDEASFDRVLERAKGPVLVDFWAAWCPPCRMLGPVIDRVADAHAGDDAVVAKVDVDVAPGLAARYGVASIPTVVVFRDGAEIDRIVGVQSEARYEAALAG